MVKGVTSAALDRDRSIVKCPFCESCYHITRWSLVTETKEPYECDCGAFFYAALPDVGDDDNARRD